MTSGSQISPSEELNAYVCWGGKPHKILTPMAESLNSCLSSGKGALKFVKMWENQLGTLAIDIHSANCDKLYFLAIEILTRTAFLNLASHNRFVWNCHSTIRELWRRYRQITRKNANRVSVEDMLGRWMKDLSRVNPSQLPSYVQLLDLEGFHKSTRLKVALDKIERHLIEDVLSNNVDDADNAGVSLITYVLEPLLDKNKKRVFESLPSLTNIACLCALEGGYKTIQRLSSLVELLGKNRFNVNLNKPPLKSYESKFTAYKNAYSIISRTYREANNRDISTLYQHIEQLLPMVGGWNRKRRSMTSETIRAEFKVRSDGKTRLLTGVVKDIDPLKRCCYFYLDNIRCCYVVSGTAKPIREHKGLRSVTLHVTDNNGESWTFGCSSAKIHFLRKADGKPIRTLQSDALPIRGWKHDPTEGTECGAVYFIPDLTLGDITILELLPGDGQAQKSDIRFLPDGKGRKLPSPVSPFPEDGQGILKSLCEWFRDYYFSNVLKYGRWRGFWKGKTPVDEKAINAQLRSDLTKYVELRGGQLHCETDVGGGHCDYIVSYVQEKVVIELKPSFATKWKQGISVQLPDYMKKVNTRYGLFVVPAFESEFKQGSDKVKELRQLQNEACRECDVIVDVIIMSFDKPVPSSKKRAGHPNGGFQHYGRPQLE